jgi:TPR repeat protein
LKAALADHVPAMLGYVRVANASLQQPGLSETSRTAIEKEIVSWVGKAADRGNGEALRVRALWRANGQAGFTADKGMAWLELERAAEAGDWPAMRLLAQAAHAGEWGRKISRSWRTGLSAPGRG